VVFKFLRNKHATHAQKRTRLLVNVKFAGKPSFTSLTRPANVHGNRKKSLTNQPTLNNKKPFQTVKTTTAAATKQTLVWWGRPLRLDCLFGSDA
jgi:hypothetical protein